MKNLMAVISSIFIIKGEDMKSISILIILATMFLSNDYIYSQSDNNSDKEINCPCMLEYEFNSDVKESLNAGENFHPVLRFLNAEVKNGMMICNYDKVFYNFKNGSDFTFVSLANVKDNWTNKGLAVVTYFSSQKFEASVLNYIYGDASAAKFDENFKSFSISDSSITSLKLKSNESVELNESKNGFKISRDDVIRMKSLAPASSVPKTLGKKRNNTAPDKLK